jgi:DNA-binding NtrC family response regulator
VKLLRAIETRTVRRLGGKKEIEVDIRIVAATNKDLQKALEDNLIREDLYYRLAVVEIYLPPLRERVGDIPLLANEFLARFAHQNGKKIQGFDDAAMEWIVSYAWQGNVRELKNAVERAVVMSRGGVITQAEIMPRHIRQSAETPTSVVVQVGTTTADARRMLVLKTWAVANGDLTRAASMLGIEEQTLQSELAGYVSNGESKPKKKGKNHAGL